MTAAPKPSRASLGSALVEFALRLPCLDANNERKLPKRATASDVNEVSDAGRYYGFFHIKEIKDGKLVKNI